MVYETVYRKDGCQLSETVSYPPYAPFESIVDDAKRLIKRNLTDNRENRFPKGEYMVIECDGHEPVAIEYDLLRLENLGL